MPMGVQRLRTPYSASGDILSYTATSSAKDAAYQWQNYPSVARVENLLNSYTVYPRFRIFRLNPDETVKEEVPPEDIQLGGSYSENYQSGQRRTLSFTLINEDKKYTPGINSIWLGAKFSLEIGMAVPDSALDEVLWFSKGVYVLTNASPSRDPDNKTVSVELADKFNIFEGKSGVIPYSYEIPVGSVIEDIFEDILNYNNGDGYPLDPKPLIYHSSFKGKVTQQTISEQAGATWGSVMLKLAEQLSAEIFYNSEGNLTVVPKSEVTNDGDKPVLYNFVDTNGDFTNNSLSFSMSDVVNRIIVIGANVNGGTCQAVAVNDDPASPLCYQRIGYRTGDVVNDSNITSDILAQERADYELRKQLILKTTMSNTVYFNPLLSVNNLITVSDTEFDLKRERFLLQSLSFSLDYSGTMSISSTNIKNLPFTTH